MGKEIKKRINELFKDESGDIISIFNFDKIDGYYTFLQEFNERGGFFSKNDSSYILDRHIIESIYYIYFLKKKLTVSRETEVADIGTGPGLPGFLFNCLIDFPQITLIDSQKRKLFWLEEYSRKNNYKNIRFLYKRGEELKIKAEILVSRSMISYPWSMEVVSNLIVQNGYYVPFLGRDNFEKGCEMKIMSYTGFELSENCYLPGLNFLGERHFKLLKKKKETKYGYPRSWKEISKEIKNGKSNSD